jgi:hypothetical protein
MIYSEEDIDFLTLSDRQFEELCYELLGKLGYDQLVWRRGGADSGRDIEGQLRITSPLVGSQSEKWFFECKRYEAGVPPEQLNPKITWADAEKPKHLVFLISSYLTNNARTWLEKISADKPYSIHVIEGKHLKQPILEYPDLITKYFLNSYAKLLGEALNNWLEHDILPSEEMQSILVSNLEPTKLTVSELAFVCVAADLSKADTPQSKHLLERLAAMPNSSTALLLVEPRNWNLSISPNRSLRIVTLKPKATIYSLLTLTNDSGVEVLIEGKKDLPTQVRY